MAKAKKRTAKTGAKKTWYQIIAPKIFNEQIIGEILLEEPSAALGRDFSINLMNLTRDMKKQNMQASFRVSESAGSKLKTDFIGYSVQLSSVKRMIRRGKEKVEYTFRSTTSDNSKVGIKAIMITRNETANSTLTSLRKACKNAVDAMFSKMDYDAVSKDVVSQKLQFSLKKKLSKVYPLKILEFRSFMLEKKGEKKKVSSEKKESPKPAAPKKAEKKAEE